MEYQIVSTTGSYSATMGFDYANWNMGMVTLKAPTNQAPAFTSANSTTFAAGTAGSFTPTASGVPAPTITESGALPSGVSFMNGVLSGTPTSTTGSPFSITFTASNGVGSPATQTFTLTVGQAPAITSANNTTFTVGTAGTFTVTATGYRRRRSLRQGRCRAE